jgi:hypothetical protein
MAGICASARPYAIRALRWCEESQAAAGRPDQCFMLTAAAAATRTTIQGNMVIRSDIVRVRYMIRP